VNRPDFAVWLVALLATAFLGVVEGIAVAVRVALGLVIWKASFPRVGECARRLWRWGSLGGELGSGGAQRRGRVGTHSNMGAISSCAMCCCMPCHVKAVPVRQPAPPPSVCTPHHPPCPLRFPVTLARLPGTSPALYRNQKMYPVTHEEPGMLLLRIDAPVFFANCVVSGRLGRLHAMREGADVGCGALCPAPARCAQRRNQCLDQCPE